MSTNRDDIVPFNFSNPETLEEARNQLTNAKKELDQYPTYYNGAAVQFYQGKFDALVKEARNEYVLMDGNLGLSTLSPIEIMVNAMKEVEIRARELQASYGHYWPENTPFLYIQKVAKESLKTIGEWNGD